MMVGKLIDAILGQRLMVVALSVLLLDVVGVSTHHTLHTAATLFGCAPAALAQQSVLEALTTRDCPAPEEADPLQGLNIG